MKKTANYSLRLGVLSALCLGLSLLTVLPAQAQTAGQDHSQNHGPFQYASPAFEKLWNRTDKQVANGSVARTFLWGPVPNTPAMQEDYQEAPGGKRLVQYYDKSRMEITNPGGDQSSQYYVSNGLIAVEMMTGRLQTGDNRFETREPANIGVAGDADDKSGPTYMTLGHLTAPAEDETGILVAASVNREGQVRFDVGDYGKKYQASYQYYEQLTKHNIAGPFWAFLKQSGPVQNPAGQVIQGRLFDPVFYATGLPVTEAYWAQVKVGGSVKDVLVQAFERRVLTFTPSNPPAFQVEMGNVGQHYFKWRYSNPPQNNAPQTGTVQASITNFAFDSGTITVTVGTKVVWTNKDIISHTVTADDKTFGSGFLAPGSSYEYTFTQPGVYNYHCTPHPFMRAKVIVV